MSSNYSVDSTEDFVVVPMPSCFDVSKPLMTHEPDVVEQAERDYPLLVALTNPSDASQLADTTHNETVVTDSVDVHQNVETSTNGSEPDNVSVPDEPQYSIHAPPPYHSPVDIYLDSSVTSIHDDALENPNSEDFDSRRSDEHGNPQLAEHIVSSPSLSQAGQPLYVPSQHLYELPRSKYVPPGPCDVPVLNIWKPPQPLSPLDQLFEMGFGDRKRNIQLLGEHNNDVQAVVQQLLADIDNDWSTKRH